MKFYTDGSCIGLSKGNPIIGWGAVCNQGVVCKGSKVGGTNVNAEMFAIENCLHTLFAYKRKLIENEDVVEILTDSKVSLQIINGMMTHPNDYDLSESINYVSANKIIKLINNLKTKMNKSVEFTHIYGHKESLGNNFADYVATQESMILQEKQEREKSE